MSLIPGRRYHLTYREPNSLIRVRRAATYLGTKPGALPDYGHAFAVDGEPFAYLLLSEGLIVEARAIVESVA